MKEFSWSQRTGFGVFMESKEWRIAYHAYEKEQNGLEAVKEWGIHKDSDETFTLLLGEAVLATKKGAIVKLTRLNQGELYVVEEGEPHILVLFKGARVLITENRNMDATGKEPVTEEDRIAIYEYVKGEEK